MEFTPEELKVREIENIVKQKQRDIAFNSTKHVYENSLHISPDKKTRQDFYKKCVSHLKNLRGSDVKIFEQYGNLLQFGVKR